MQPAFHRSSIVAFAPLMVERTRALLNHWEAAARERRPVDVYFEMRRLSLDVVTRALFGLNVHEDARVAGNAPS
jgi:cytochrome P450